MYLLDASALYPLIKSLKENLLDYTNIITVLDLTLYEAGNAVWKEWKLGLIKNLNKVLLMIEKVLNEINKVSIQAEDIKNIAKIAIKNNITFYVAAYIYIAEKYSYTLVTEDNDILKTYSKAITTKTLLKKLKTKQ